MFLKGKRRIKYGIIGKIIFIVIAAALIFTLFEAFECSGLNKRKTRALSLHEKPIRLLEMRDVSKDEADFEDENMLFNTSEKYMFNMSKG